MSVMQQSMLHCEACVGALPGDCRTRSSACNGCLLVWAASDLATDAAGIVEQGHGRGGESVQLGTDASALTSANRRGNSLRSAGDGIAAEFRCSAL